MKIAKLYIKGLKEPFEISEVEGNKIDLIKQDSSLPDNHYVSVGKWHGYKSEIRYTIWEEVAEKTNADDMEEEYYKNRGKYLTDTERYKNIEFYKLFVRIMDDREPTKDEILKVQEIQKEFFTNNPYRLQCDPECYKSFVGNVARLGSFLHILERIIQKDRYFVKYKMCG
jgi:hypothetical protein